MPQRPALGRALNLASVCMLHIWLCGTRRVGRIPWVLFLDQNGPHSKSFRGVDFCDLFSIFDLASSVHRVVLAKELWQSKASKQIFPSDDLKNCVQDFDF